ncbi:MAG TPA: hypothetical protein VLA74_08855 [Nitrososphaeraceae archaeon]|nr:hypothetical protein [Nitrososphaeraceae archaeon]
MINNDNNENYKNNDINDLENVKRLLLQDQEKERNGKANEKQQQQKLQVKPNSIIITEQDKERNRILEEIQKLREENPDLTFEQWSNTLKEKRQKLNDKVNEYFPKVSFKILLELDFV